MAHSYLFQITVTHHHRHIAQRRRFLILGDAAFEEVGLLLDVHHLGEPGEGVGDVPALSGARPQEMRRRSAM
jgi:hypothetical protein